MKINLFNTNKVKDDSYEFLPIIAEIEEEPINPAGQTVFWLIITLIFLTSLWLYFGKVDVVVSSRGKIIPDGEIKIIQPLETGVIKDILVKEGDFVKRGQVLVEIDSSTTQPELNALQKNLKYTKEENNRLNALIKNEKYNASSASSAQEMLYESSIEDLKAQLNIKKMEMKQIQEQIKTTKAEKDNYTRILALNMDKERRLKNVIDIIALEDLEKVKIENANYRTNIASLNFKIQELLHQEEKIASEYNYIKSNFKTQLLNQLTDKELKEISLESDIEKITFRNEKQRIVSPVDGYVNTLLIHTIGGVVTPAKEIISIVPVNTQLSAKVRVMNKDIGFIKPNMPVQIKIDTFDFQKYGMLNGVVSEVSKDSIEAPKEGLVYDVFIKPTTQSLMVDGKQHHISTGMSLTAEIKVGKRRIIEFFIYPIIKYWNEAISIK